MTMPCAAILLIGPTGSGKTPLGECLEQNGLLGRVCHHFDFGANLRELAAGALDVPVLSGGDREIVRRSLRNGVLLENEHAGIVAAIFDAFRRRRHVGAADLVVLNGLPRHVGQAELMERFVHIEQVACLDCTAEVVMARIRGDTGGDRSGRPDDSSVEVKRKLALFAGRTVALLDHYAANGVKVHHIEVGVHTGPEEMRRQLERLLVVSECQWTAHATSDNEAR